MKFRIIILLALALVQNGCHVGRFFIYNFADIRDYKKFPAKEIKRSEQPFYFIEGQQSHALRLPEKIHRHRKDVDFSKALRRSGSVALIIIRNDSILYEWFREGYSAARIHPSFSMAKSFMSVMIGVAIKEGKIKSADEPITNYIDFFDKEKFGKITIQHLLDMQSGIRFSENYFNPFGDIAKYYYGTNLKKYMRKLDTAEAPGQRFRYISVNSQILALILENATGKTPAEYLQEKIWTPLGMEYDGSWNVDSKKNNTEKAFCCINGRAKDFAKLGRLYLRKGNWNGKQIVSAQWVDESVNFKKNKNGFFYSNQWWHTRKKSPLKDTLTLKQPFYVYYPSKQDKPANVFSPSGDYFAQGFLGQYVYVAPEKNMIIVRLGKREGGVLWPQIFSEISKQN